MTAIVRAARGAARHILLRSGYAGGPRFAAPPPESMRRPSDASTLMTEARAALDRTEDQVVFGGVIFVNADQIGALPNRDLASIYTQPLPKMEYFRWPVSALARRAWHVVRKLIAPFIRPQERFNLDLIETLRRMEDRLETQQHTVKQLRERITALEERLGSWE